MIHLLTQAKHNNFARLWWAQLISQFGDRIHQLALVGFMAERSFGSAFDLAKLMSFTILPVFLMQPIAGVLVDRWEHKTTLFICDILRGFLVLTIPFVFIFKASLIPIYIIVFLVFSLSRFYVPAKMSIIPDLVEDDHLLMANSFVSVTGMIAFVLGCALGGLLVDQFGARNGFIIDAVTYFVSAALLWSMNLPKDIKENMTRLKAGLKSTNTIIQELREGFQYLIQHKELRFIIHRLFVLLAAAGSVYVVIIVFIQQSFNSITKDLSVIAIALGVGIFLGAIGYGKWGNKERTDQTINTSLLAGGVMLIVFALIIHRYPNLWLANGLAMMLGVVIGPVFIAANTMAHVVSDESKRGQVFSALEIVIHLAFLLAMLISSWIAEHVGPVWILATVGTLIGAVGIMSLFIKKGQE